MFHWVGKIDKMVMIFIFGLALYIPLLVGIFQADQISSSVEKRTLTAFPAIPDSISTVNTYPTVFNTYYSDHFGLREQLTQAYFSLIYKMGAYNSIGEVTFGQDGWMFLGNIKPGVRSYSDPMGDAMNKNQFSKQQLEKFAESIMAIKNWLKNKGIEYIYVIAPNKHSIYFDKLPKYISKLNKQSATDQLVAHLQQHTDVHVVDLRTVLLAEKKNHRVFFKTDTHWTFYGTNAAQFEIMKEIKSLFPRQVNPIFLKDHHFWLSTRNDGDLAALAKTGDITEEFALLRYKPECKIVQKRTDVFECRKQGLNTVIYKDSFFNYLTPYIATYFHRSSYLSGRIEYDSLLHYVEQEKPDIVIEEVVEREFPYLPTDAFLKQIN